MQLTVYLDETQQTAKAFAEKLGVDPSIVTRWRNRTTIPNPKHIKLIAEATSGSVTANDFYAATAVSEPAA